MMAETLPAELLREREALAADAAATLDDLLSRWHGWQHASRQARGFNSQACGTEDYRTSRQYDDMNGALDGDLDDVTMRALNHQVEEMLHPWRTAIYFEARNLRTGRAVWISPRLPQDSSELRAVVDEARMQLTRRLRSAGVMVYI